MLSGTARQWINDLAENSIQTWFDMQTTFTENFEGTYKRPHNIGDLQRCRRADDETSQTFLARWLDMKNSCEGVTTNPPSSRSLIVWREASYSAIACYEKGTKGN
jgi:hypothetical protein